MITFAADTFFNLFRVMGGNDGGVVSTGGGSRVGGSAMDNLFASAVACADVRPGPPIAIAEAAAVAAVAVVAFAAVAVMVGIAAVAAMVVLLTMAFFKETPLTWAFTLMCIMAFSAIFASI